MKRENEGEEMATNGWAGLRGQEMYMYARSSWKGGVVWCGVLCCGGRGHPELIEDAGVRSGKVVEMNGWLLGC